MLTIIQSAMSQPEIDGIPIQQIWIVLDSGLCLFQTSFEKDKTDQIDNKLFPGFISAIASFATEVSKRPIRKIQLGELILNQYKKNDLLACISTKKDISDEKALTSLFDRILYEFEAEYRPILESSDVFDMEHFESFQSKILHIFRVNLSLTISDLGITPSLNLLFKILGKDCDKVITSVIQGDKLAIVGDKGQTKIIVATLEQFSPHRRIEIKYWIEDTIIDSYELIGIPKKLAKFYEKEGWRTFHLDGKSKFKGQANRFISTLIKDVKEITDQSSREYVIATRMNYFTSRVGTILDLYNKEEVTKKALEILRKDINKDLFELIVTFITNTIDPSIADNELFAKKASAWRKLDAF